MLFSIPPSSAMALRWSAALVCALMLSLTAPSAQAPAPPNDDLYLATQIEPGMFTGTTVGATRGHDEYGALCTPGGPAADNLETVWWEYTLQSDDPGRITIDLAGTDFDAVLTVQSGYDGDIYACASGPNARIENIPTRSYGTYSIRVSGVGAARGNVVLTLTRDGPMPAPNDDFADATPITTGGYFVETNDGATREPGEANASCASSDQGASLWWAYTAPQAGEVSFDIGFSYSGILSLHDASGAELACDRERIEGVAVAAGETVWVRTSSTLNTGPVRLQVWNGDAGRPANDDRDQAGPLVWEAIYNNSTTAGATSEPGEAPASCAPDAGRSGWWRLDNSVPVQLAIRINGARVLSVHDADGAELACSATPGADGAVRLDNVMLPAGPLFLRVSDPAGTPYGRSVYFTFGVTPELVNDDRADAVTIAEPGTLLGTTVNATAEADEPVLPGECYFHPGTDTNESAWWSYTAPDDGTLLVDLDGSEFDTLLSIHDEDLVLLGCDDDDPTNDSPLDDTSRLANVPVVAGQRVLIRVSGKATNAHPGRPTTGDVQLRLGLFPAASTMTVATGTTAGEPLWSYPYIYGLVCNSAFVDMPYRADPFTVPLDGFYTFTGSFTGYTGGVFVMRAPFDAETWTCDDVLTHGYGTDADPSIAQGRPVELEAGVDYVLVASQIVLGFEFGDEGGPYTIEALGPAPVSFASLVAAEGPAAAGGALLSAPRPNPTRAGAALTLSLGAAETVTVEVLNALGQRVAVLQDGPLSAGVHDLRLDALALAPGLYIVRATGETFAETRRLTVVR